MRQGQECVLKTPDIQTTRGPLGHNFNDLQDGDIAKVEEEDEVCRIFQGLYPLTLKATNQMKVPKFETTTVSHTLPHTTKSSMVTEPHCDARCIPGLTYRTICSTISTWWPKQSKIISSNFQINTTHAYSGCPVSSQKCNHEIHIAKRICNMFTGNIKITTDKC